jgi:hypothetical protein
MKSVSTSSRLHGATYQEAVIFILSVETVGTEVIVVYEKHYEVQLQRHMEVTSPIKQKLN